MHLKHLRKRNTSRRFLISISRARPSVGRVLGNHGLHDPVPSKSDKSKKDPVEGAVFLRQVPCLGI